MADYKRTRKRLMCSLRRRSRGSLAHTGHSFWVARITHEKAVVAPVGSEDTPLLPIWVTALKDEYSRSILAMHLSFAAPGYISYAAVLVACALRTGCLPDAVIVETEEDARSLALRTLLVEMGIELWFDPSGEEDETENQVGIYQECFEYDN